MNYNWDIQEMLPNIIYIDNMCFKASTGVVILTDSPPPPRSFLWVYLLKLKYYEHSNNLY